MREPKAAQVTGHPREAAPFLESALGPAPALASVGGTDHVQQRALGGVLSLGARELAIKLLALAGWVIISRLLEPATFGLFAVSNFALNVFIIFSELGLGAAYVRERGEIARRDLDALFTFQLAWAGLLGTGAFLAAPYLEGLYGVGGTALVVRALAVAVVIVSLRSVPSMLSQRRLAFGPIVVADVTAQLAYWLTACAVAFSGLGPWSAAAAVVTSATVGTLVLFSRAGWLPRLQWDWRGLGGAVRFGMMYQGQLAASFAKYAAIPVLGGLAYGPVAVGYLTWAHQLTVVPVQLAQLVARVSFPAFSSLQGDDRAFEQMVASTLKWTCRISFPLFAVLVGLAPAITSHIYGPTWLPAVPALYLFALSTWISVAVIVLIPALYSSGKAAAALHLNTWWTVLTWLVAALLIFLGAGFESIGASFAAGTAAAFIAAALAVKSLRTATLLRAVLPPTATALVALLALHLIAPTSVRDLATLAVVAALAGSLTLVLNLWGDRAAAMEAVLSVFSRKAQSL